MADNVLLLGGGFIGQALAKRLAENDQSVTVISRSTPEHLTKGINWLQGDLGDTTLMRKQLSECRAVVHLASTSTPGHHVYAPTHEAEENLLPLLHLLEMMGDHVNIPLVFMSSGGAIYGHPVTLPVSETHALAPLSNHAAGKAAAEHFLGVFSHQGHPVTILRPSNIYGQYQPLKAGFGIIRTILEHLNRGTSMTIWGDGKIVRDYLYIDDLISACLAVLEDPSVGTFNIGSGLGYSINELCMLAEKVTGKALDLRYEPARSVDVRKVVLDNMAIRNRYGWQPQFTIEQGIHLTWKWLQKLP
ncbi:MAG: NAD-dependent epimerase/dehydratase family protein [Candidatus Sedimenticola sp. (ex Thyasira tokunagai)]